MKILIWLIGASILIGFVSQAQLPQKDESGSPLYEYKAAQLSEEFGLAPSGSANSELEFGSLDTADLTVQPTVQTEQTFSLPSIKITGGWRCVPTGVFQCGAHQALTGGWRCGVPLTSGPRCRVTGGLRCVPTGVLVCH
jgi:hypothetical protein